MGCNSPLLIHGSYRLPLQGSMSGQREKKKNQKFVITARMMLFFLTVVTSTSSLVFPLTQTKALFQLDLKKETHHSTSVLVGSLERLGHTKWDKP